MGPPMNIADGILSDSVERNRQDIIALRDALKELTLVCMEIDKRLEKLERLEGVPRVSRTLTLDGDPDS